MLIGACDLTRVHLKVSKIWLHWRWICFISQAPFLFPTIIGKNGVATSRKTKPGTAHAVCPSLRRQSFVSFGVQSCFRIFKWAFKNLSTLGGWTDFCTHDSDAPSVNLYVMGKLESWTADKWLDATKVFRHHDSEVFQNSLCTSRIENVIRLKNGASSFYDF